MRDDKVARIEVASEKIESNNALVLEAFDTLFNKRDNAAAERFWSPNNIQHNSAQRHIAPGRGVCSISLWTPAGHGSDPSA